MAVLELARKLPQRLATDPIDQELAGELIASPERGCGHSRSGWIDTSQNR